MMTLRQFAAAMQCTLMTAEAWHAPFEAAMAEREINTQRRVAAFLAQVGHETRSLSCLEENLNYSAQRLCEVWPRRFQTLQSAAFYEHAPERLANLVYASRMGNGAYESGDGWRYHGRGPLMLTGADEYRRCGAALNLALIEHPELLLQPNPGATSAAWYWLASGCNVPADADDVVAVTRIVNGGEEGLDQRVARYEKALEVLA